MRRLLISSLVSLVWVVPALAQGAPQDQTMAPNVEQEMSVPKAAPETVAPKADQETVAPKGDRETAAPKTSRSTVGSATTQDDDKIISELVRSIEHSVQTELAHSGYTDIQMVPTSFLVRAKNSDGQTVMLELSPDSLAALRDTPSDQQDDSDSAPSVRPDGPSGRADAPSGQPPVNFPGANAAE
jgi:hypothetical protein